MSGSCTAAIGGDLTGACAAGSNDGEGADCWEGGCLCGFAGGALTGMLVLMQQVNRGGEHLGGGEGCGLLGDGVGVGGDAPWCFGMGPHRGGNGEDDGGGGGFTLADCCPGCVCRFAGGRLTGSCTAGTEDADCCLHSHAGIGGALTGGCAAGSNGMRGRRGRNCWAPQIGCKSLHSRRSMLAPQSLNPVDGGSEETQYSVLSTRYSVFSRLVNDRIDYAFFMRATVTVWIALNRGIQK